MMPVYQQPARVPIDLHRGANGGLLLPLPHEIPAETEPDLADQATTWLFAIGQWQAVRWDDLPLDAILA
jgi:hypothetical protein